jgi:hypothetical protein
MGIKQLQVSSFDQFWKIKQVIEFGKPLDSWWVITNPTNFGAESSVRSGCEMMQVDASWGFRLEWTESIDWGCLCKLKVLQIKLHPRRPQTVIPNPLQRLFACLWLYWFLMPAMFDQLRKAWVSCHAVSIFCHAICIWDNKSKRETSGRQVIRRIKNLVQHDLSWDNKKTQRDLNSRDKHETQKKTWWN